MVIASQKHTDPKQYYYTVTWKLKNAYVTALVLDQPKTVYG